MVGNLNIVDYLITTFRMQVVNSKIVNLTKLSTELISQVKKTVANLQRNFSVIALIGFFFLIVTTTGVLAQSSQPVITIEANPFKVSGNSGHNYIIVADQAPTGTVTINYEVVPDTGNPIAKTVDITGNNVEFRVDVSESHTQVRLISGNGYSLGNQIVANKIDNPVEATAAVPGLQIKFKQNSVTEGNSATLVARSTPAAQRRFNSYVRFDLSFNINGGEFIPLDPKSSEDRKKFFEEINPVVDVKIMGQSANHGVNLVGEYREVVYTFYEVDNSDIDFTVGAMFEIDFHFTTAISEIKRASGSDVTYIRVLDKKTTPLIKIETTTEEVIEGESFPVNITALRAPNPGSEISVEYTSNDNDSGFFSSFDQNNNQVTLTTTESAKTIMVNTLELDGFQNQGMIEVSLSESSNYEIDPQNRKVSVVVLDADSAEVSISAVTPSIIEGQDAQFKVTAKQAVSSNLDINININDVGSKNFFTWRVPTSVMLPVGEREASFSIRTGTQADSNGSFSVTITNGIRYRAITPSTAEVMVEADEDQEIQGQRTSVASLVVQNILSIVTSQPNTRQTHTKLLNLTGVMGYIYYSF